MKNRTKKNNFYRLPSPTNMVFLGVAASLLLAGCASKGGKISAFAISPPDEFAVTSNPPLTVPPGDALLPMPLDNGKANGSGADATDPAARSLQTIFGEGNNTASNAIQSELASQGLNDNDIAFLRQANALKPDPAVRQQLSSNLTTRATPASQVSDYLASALTPERKLTAAQLENDGNKKTALRPGVILTQ